MENLASRRLIVKNAKIFSSYVNIFEFSYSKEIVQSWLIYVTKFSSIIQSCFLTETLKQNYCQLIYFTFLNSHERKVNFSLKSVIVPL